MVVFSRNTVEVIKLDACEGLLPTSTISSGNGTPEKPAVLADKSTQQLPFHKAIRLNDNIHGWQYIVTRIIREQDLIGCYKIVLNHMLGFVKSDITYKYSIMFNIIPAIIKNTNGSFYIIMRIKFNPKATINITMHDVIARVISSFNPLYVDTLYMETETERRNISFLHWLYIKEYIPYSKKTYKSRSHSRTNSSGNILEMDMSDLSQPPIMCKPATYINEFYATSSLDTSDRHLPPLPKTLGMDTYNQLSSIFTPVVNTSSMDMISNYNNMNTNYSNMNMPLVGYLQSIYGNL